MFPTPPPTRSIRSRRQGGSSGEDSWDSAGSRIDSQDDFRMGGPGLLPSWPVDMMPSTGISAQLTEGLMNLAFIQLARYELNYHRIMVVQRYSRGHVPTPADNTLYISLYTSSNDNWVKALDDMLSAADQLGFSGRIEMIDHRALGGMKSFAPDTSSQLVQEWEGMKTLIIRRLTALEVNWSVVVLQKRGYWEDVAINTVVIKAFISSRALAITARDRVAFDIDSAMDQFNLQVEIVRADLLWGLFSRTSSSSESPSLGWPFTNSYNSMGMSIGRTDTPAMAGTLGGYLQFTDSNGCEQFLGVTCYHIIREGPDGEIDSVIQRDGSKDLEIPCQSPSGSDVQAAFQYANREIGIPPEGIESLTATRQVIVRNDLAIRDRQLSEVRSFNPNIGAIVAASGFRNAALDSGLASPFILLDWAILHIRNGRDSLNYTGDLEQSAPTLQRESQFITRIDPIPNSQSAVIKKGRTTGVTVGTISGLTSIAIRIPGLPAGLHHRGFEISSGPAPFAKPGDSGSWVLNMSGQVIGLLFGGDVADGSAMVMPMNLVVKDIEEKVGIPSGTLKV
ncbi:hypothetical protein McanMca71_006840 [Microsporum canis]|uniref:Uncharacterized protein n=1 Tax=Arthroderma otae (strain ATCC MYA-4605 / CBS 113480) TaxID=554155 RepID=C5FN33_ARTOC|nr:uncharacterized protein MCYG_04088 [Microsporum canis CBS 113480]EEQ31269.1 predicted protein [Microsporum canis CBS 113480]